MIAQILTEWGFSVRTADDGADALLLLRERRPDVVVLDLLLPYAQIDGEKFLALIAYFTDAASAEHPPIRIVLVSADHWAEEHLHGLHVDAFVEKPFSLDELQAAVMGTERPPS